MGKLTYSENSLVDQNDAISAYLDALLNDACVTNYALELSEDLAQEKHDNTLPNTILQEVPPQEIFDGEKYGDKKPENQSISIHSAESPKNNNSNALLPKWVQSNFQTLSFSVADVVLSAPLSELNGILKMEGKISTLPGQAPWCIGVLRNSNQNVSIIDLAILLKSDSSEISQSSSVNTSSVKKRKLEYIVLTGNGKWGLACHTVDNVMRVEKEQIQWQPECHKKLIMGALTEKMIFLLNIDELLNRLENTQMQH